MRERAKEKAPCKSGRLTLVATSELNGLPRVRGSGQVTLVGAGPGDPELLTLKAIRTLQSADVVLFDALVSDEVLAFARAEAKKILVGKRGGRPSCRQEDINEIMMKLARKGLHVVRLKSGDPMIFGRAGEEIERLKWEGIPVTVVPGVTAALGAAARLNVSLTHRDHAQAVTFVTAHSRDGKLPTINWDAYAAGDMTLVVYMGARTAPELARRLLSAGRHPTTPVVAIWAVSRPNERYRIMDLRELETASIASDDPVVICIGSPFGACEAGSQGQNAAPADANANPVAKSTRSLDIAMQK